MSAPILALLGLTTFVAVVGTLLVRRLWRGRGEAALAAYREGRELDASLLATPDGLRLDLRDGRELVARPDNETLTVAWSDAEDAPTEWRISREVAEDGRLSFNAALLDGDGTRRGAITVERARLGMPLETALRLDTVRVVSDGIRLVDEAGKDDPVARRARGPYPSVEWIGWRHGVSLEAGTETDAMLLALLFARWSEDLARAGRLELNL